MLDLIHPFISFENYSVYGNYRNAIGILRQSFKLMYSV